jgi:hypothetical protein
MKMLEDEEDPFIPSPSEASRFRRLDKMPKHERLKTTVRMFLAAIRWVPLRAVDCDQMLVDELWSRLCEETKPSRKKKQRAG